ncbi:MAG: C4-type zinc ribbon domain-containing protein [Vicinamibacterales bacterium]
MAPELERLIELQRLDTTIADARARVAAHPQRLAEADQRLAEATQALDAVKQRLKDSHSARSEAEKNAGIYQARLSKFKDQLAAVKTNREYTAMQHEIETAQKDLGVAEESVLERMMESDGIAAEIKQAEAALVTRRKETDAEKKTLADELVVAEAALEAALAAKAGVVAGLEPRVLKVFEQVSKQRKGIALSEATRDGLCSVCHVRLRPPVFQQIRQNSGIVQCESCQRIMYYIPPPAPVEPPTIITS